MLGNPSLSDILEMLIKRAYRADSRIPHGILSIKNRAMEYGTIKLTSHRQSGHTTAIKNLTGVSSLILVDRKWYGTYFKGDKGLCLSLRSDFTKTVAKRLDKGRPYPIDYIFIDNASYCRPSDLKKVYDPKFLKAAFGDNLPIIIFLG